MVRKLGILVVSWALVLVSMGLGSASDEKKAAQTPALDQEATFEMREVSAFGLTGQAGRKAYVMGRGQSVQCSTEPDKEVKVYPKLKSKHPFYGKVKFGASRANPKAGVEYHFVIDESGEGPSEPKPVESKSGDSKPGGTSSLLKTLASSLPARGPQPVRCARASSQARRRSPTTVSTSTPTATLT